MENAIKKDDELESNDERTGLEFKTFALELKKISEEGEFEGYASVFNNVDEGNDRVMPGAFTKTLKKSQGRVPILANHYTLDHIGWGIEAVEDKKGLKVRGKLNLDVQAGREKHALAKQAAEVGAMMGLSIGFRRVKTSWDKEVRVLEEVKLYEYSITPFPMNEKARITNVKDGRLVHVPGDVLDNPRKCEAFLRDAGFSRQAAKAMSSKVIDGQCDVGVKDLLESIEKVRGILEV